MKSQAQPTGQQSRENSAEPIEKDVRNAQMPRCEKAAPTPQLSSTNTPRRNYASVAASQPAQTPENPWTQVVYKSRKTNAQKSAKPTAKIEHQGRRILFPREVTENQKSEADLMLVLNEALQKAGEGPDARFSRVRYAPSGAVSALLTEKANAGLLIPRLSNVLIREAKTIDSAIVGAEVLEHWQRLKVHGMSLDRYLGEGKMSY